METIYLITALLIKHFVVDFLVQDEYQWKNKGTYGHPGGILHAWLHGGSTTIILELMTDFPHAVLLGLADMFFHYHIDWAKVNINKKFGWKPHTHKEYWYLLGLDQLLHNLTYVWIVWSVI